MIIISAGFMKSASTLVNDYQVEVIKVAAQRNGQKELEKFSSGRGAAYRGSLGFKTFLILLYVNFRHGDVALKTHGKPSFFVRLLVSLGLAKVTYSYRDPRDVALSMVDHGSKTRDKLKASGESLKGSKGFRQVFNVQDAIPIVRQEVEVWHQWKAFKDVFFIEYEDLMIHKYDYFKKMVEYFGYPLNESELRSIFDKYEQNKSRNFNKGTMERFRTEMAQEELDHFNQQFQQDLVAMGYSI